jgi:exonuclease VII small subunit
LDEGQTEGTAAESTASDDVGQSTNERPVDLDSLSAEELKAGYMRQQDYTRKTMDRADEGRQNQADREAIAKERQELDALRQQVLQMQQTAATQAQQGPPQPTAGERLRANANGADLTEADRAGLHFVADLSDTVTALQQQNQALEQRLAQWEPHLQQIGQTTQTLQEQNQAAVQKVISEQSAEAIDIFGEDVAQNQGVIDFVARNLNTPNPLTGETYTVAELVGAATNRSVEEASNARSQHRQQKNQAKARAQSNGAAAPPVQSSGAISYEQALSEIGATL